MLATSLGLAPLLGLSLALSWMVIVGTVVGAISFLSAFAHAAYAAGVRMSVSLGSLRLWCSHLCVLVSSMAVWCLSWIVSHMLVCCPRITWILCSLKHCLEVDESSWSSPSWSAVLASLRTLWASQTAVILLKMSLSHNFLKQSSRHSGLNSFAVGIPKPNSGFRYNHFHFHWSGTF